MKYKRFRITIIGVGLIGGSTGLCLRRKKIIPDLGKISITGVGRHPDKLKLAKKIGAIDDYTVDFKIGVESADFVIIAVPVQYIVPVFMKIYPSLKDGCIVTDVGSVKAEVMEGIFDFLKSQKKQGKKVFFIGSHPMTGSEKSGIKYADFNIFKSATVVVTPFNSGYEKQYKDALDIVVKIWKATGAEIVLMTPSEHDRAVALTSHLPHVISAVFVHRVSERDSKNKKISKILAGSFRDMTRITDSDSDLWANISVYNKEEIKNSINEFIDEILRFKKNISDLKYLKKYFLTAKNKREKLIKEKFN